MSVRRQLLNAVCIVSVGSASLAAQERNPFAEWDRLHRATTAATAGAAAGNAPANQNHSVLPAATFPPSPFRDAAAAAPDRFSNSVPANSPRSVQFFSPTSASAEDGLHPDVTMRERMKTSATGQPSVPVAAQGVSAPIGFDRSISRARLSASGSNTAPALNSIQPSATQSRSLQQPSPQSPASDLSQDRTTGTSQFAFGSGPLDEPAIQQHIDADQTNSFSGQQIEPADSRVATSSSTIQTAGPSGIRTAAAVDGIDLQPGSGVRQVEHSAAETSRQVGQAENPSRANDATFLEFLNQNARASASQPEPELSPVLPGPETVPRRASSTSHAAPLRNASLSTAGPGRIQQPAATAGPQSPGVSIEWKLAGELNVGQECELQMVLHNHSKSIIREVVAEALLPAGLQVIAANPAPAAGSTSPTWTFGNLQPDESRSVVLTVIPLDRSEVRLDGFVRMTGAAAAVFSVQEPKIEIAVSGPETVEIGQQVSYTVRVANPGTGVARNAIIQAVIPEGLVHRRGAMLSIEVGTLEPGESRQAKLNLTAVGGGNQQMAVRVIADGNLEHATTTGVMVAEPLLQIVMDGPQELMAGRTGNYSLNVSNLGNVASANVRAKLRVPAGFEFEAADRGGKFNADDRSIEWFVGTVQPGDKSRFEVSLKATETGNAKCHAGVISELGKVTATEYQTMVEGSAVLNAGIVASADSLRAGDEVTYRIEIENTGTRMAENVGLSCELSPGLQLIDARGPSDRIAENGVVVFRSLPEIQAGKSAIFLIKAKCASAGEHGLRLRVASESVTGPLIAEETTTVIAR